ncbi:MAG TPA: DUF4301 family protein [Candidatus Polarisedimenticolaceae bacterium]|nr:DUF4301 family protein [Candidatus Polarisedimenticolaceae bacterium]
MPPFTEVQKAQLRERGISEDEANRQLALLAAPRGFPDVLRPCRAGDGIEAIARDREEELVDLHETAAKQGRCSKFVPASGAATRMFQELLSGNGAEALLAALDRFAFADDLRAELTFREQEVSEATIVDALLGADGLGYATMPKGLIPFHRYDAGPRTAFEEHLVEATSIVRDSEGVCRIHVTVSPEHLHAFRLLADRVVPKCEKRLGVRYALTWSVQKAETDTLAGAPGGGAFVADDGTLVLRPAGHGALLWNLQDTKGDVVFVKNIDNVQPDTRRAATVRWKKILGGRLVELQRSVFLHVARLRARPTDPAHLDEAAQFAQGVFGCEPPRGAAPAEMRGKALLQCFERPLRVCGVVRNTGEPGGGPYWVRRRDGRVTRQIVEAAEIDPSRAEVMREATHFNPVDLVCGLRNVDGKPFDLAAFVDPRAVIVGRKSHQGRDLVAFERPGLWNGGMADWLTVFVEVPIETFTPVKTVMDLLRPEHQA